MKKNPTITANKHQDRQKPSPTIGLLIDWLSAPYHAELWSGVAQVAKEQQINLLTFLGRELRSSLNFYAQANVIYELIDVNNIDGLLLCADSIGNYVSKAEFLDFCQHYQPLPMVNIGQKLAGMPNVMVENETGMRELMVHLIETHAYRHFAFIGGSQGNVDADLRYKIYCELLAEYNLPFYPELVVTGNFIYEEAKKAMTLLLAQNHIDFEVVVAADDGMALAALEILQSQNIQVPHDVALVGYDDEAGSQHTIPPLTTVRQSMFEQGRQAAELLLAILRQDTSPPKQIILPSQLVIRQSCGCLSLNVTHGAANLVSLKPPKNPAAEETFSTTFNSQRKNILLKMQQAMDIPVDNHLSKQVEQLLDSFFSALQNQNNAIFLTSLKNILRQGIELHLDVMTWQGAISALRNQILTSMGPGSILTQAENLWQQARIMIGEMAQHSKVYQNLKAKQQNERLRAVCHDLITTFDKREMMTILADALPSLGIESAYLSLYEDPAEPTAWSRLILAYNQQEQLDLEADGWRFPSPQLVPEGLLPQERAYHLLVIPLYFKADQLGFVLFETSQLEADIPETLGEQISSALKGALLVQQVNHHATNLQKEVAARTADLAAMNKQLRHEVVERQRADEALKSYSEQLEEMVEERTKKLQEAQERLTRQDRLAVLGQLAGGVGHELRNPLGVISNAVYFLQLLHPEADESTTEYLDIISTRIQEAEKIISDLLNLSRTRVAKKEETKVADLVAEVLQRHPPPELITAKIEIATNLPVVFVDFQQIGQVLTNLVTNAYQAMPNGGQLTIKAEVAQAQVYVSIADTGSGMSSETIHKIFEPLFTTKIKGIGLGLVVSKNLVEVNGGKIEVESKTGQGSIFTLTLPT